MKKDKFLSLLEDRLTDKEFDIAIKLSHIKFEKSSIRNKYYQSILDGDIDLLKEWEPISSLYNKYERDLIRKVKKGDTKGINMNSFLVKKIINKIK